MKAWIFIVFLSLMCCSANPVKECSCKKIRLYGDVKIVTGRADFDVKIVEHHQDLSVRRINTKPRSCGQWRIVEKNPDFTIRLVDSHPDFTIKYVEHHPGVAK